jgi:hypothetical protein
MWLTCDRRGNVLPRIVLGILFAGGHVVIVVRNPDAFWGSVDSPKGKYRVELYGASALDKLFHKLHANAGIRAALRKRYG